MSVYWKLCTVFPFIIYKTGTKRSSYKPFTHFVISNNPYFEHMKHKNTKLLCFFGWVLYYMRCRCQFSGWATKNKVAHDRIVLLCPGGHGLAKYHIEERIRLIVGTLVAQLPTSSGIWAWRSIKMSIYMPDPHIFPYWTELCIIYI